MNNLSTISDDITASELTDLLIKYWKLKSDYDLANSLGIDRRSVYRYRNRKTSDIQTKIIIDLLRDIAYLEKKTQK